MILDYPKKVFQRIGMAGFGTQCMLDTFNNEGPQAPSNDASYFTTTLPSWREFAKGISTPSLSSMPNTSLSSETLYNKINQKKYFPSFFSDLTINIQLRSQLNVLSPLHTLPEQIPSQVYLPKLLVSYKNMNSRPSVDVVDLTKIPQGHSQAGHTAQICFKCGRVIYGDICRHMRTHDSKGGFKCLYPRVYCPHVRGFFNRRHELKKHLLHKHFVLCDKNVKSLKSLTGKLEHEGTCPCGKRMKASEWLEHIVARDPYGSFECRDLRVKNAEAERAHEIVSSLG
jgi:hypothetical protein